MRHKKCNPYKNGPAEWKTVEYVTPGRRSHNGKEVFTGDHYYPNNNNMQGYANEFGTEKNGEGLTYEGYVDAFNYV